MHNHYFLFNDRSLITHDSPLPFHSGQLPLHDFALVMVRPRLPKNKKRNKDVNANLYPFRLLYLVGGLLCIAGAACCLLVGQWLLYSGRAGLGISGLIFLCGCPISWQGFNLIEKSRKDKCNTKTLDG
jgi:hypothetical protein